MSKQIKELSKGVTSSVKELPEPGIRILISVLIIAVAFMTGMFLKEKFSGDSRKDDQIQALSNENRDLNIKNNGLRFKIDSCGSEVVKWKHIADSAVYSSIRREVDNYKENKATNNQLDEIVKQNNLLIKKLKKNAK